MQIGLEKMFDILAIPAYGEKKKHIKKGSSLTKLSKIQD